MPCLSLVDPTGYPLPRMTPCPQTTPILPHDVLLIVASFADRRSLLALLATSLDLNSDCGKYLLWDPVVLHGDWKIISFIYFMRPYKRKRWRHIHSLCLRGGSVTTHVAEELARTIPRASNLQYLELEDAEETLGAHPNLALAFAAIPSVKHIVIERGYQHVCRMLEAMHWPLETAVLRTTAYNCRWQDPDSQDRMHPAALLKNSHATLRSLECDAWSDCNLILPSYPVYPKLESLSVAGVWCPRAAQWAISYPNLKQLTVHTVESDDFRFMSMDDIANQAAIQSLNMNEYAAQAQQWDELEQFQGGVLDFYLLGFSCRVRDISLSLRADTLELFSPVMATSRPRRLALSIYTDLFSDPTPTYLYDPGLANLESLKISVFVWVGGRDDHNGDSDVDHFLGPVLNLIRRASTRQFTFSLKVESIDSRKRRNIFSSSSPEPDDPHEQKEQVQRRAAGPLSPLETWAMDVDVDALASHFFQEALSLESVTLDVWPADLSIWKHVESSRAQRSESGGQLQDATSLVS